MTPENKIKFKANAQARSLVLLPKKEAERIETNYYVEGYAARYEPLCSTMTAMNRSMSALSAAVLTTAI